MEPDDYRIDDYYHCYKTSDEIAPVCLIGFILTAVILGIATITRAF